MIKRDSLSLLSCLPLMVLMAWQGGSCKSTKTNNHATPNDNHSMNSNSTPTQSSEVKGNWGGQGIAIQLSDGGGEISFDCAHGRITEKIVLDSQGHFSARGGYVQEHPGPIRVEQDPKEEAATYKGSVSGDTMTLSVIISASQTIGPYTLTRGSQGRIRRCA